jgi:hypothetical protein
VLLFVLFVGCCSIILNVGMSNVQLGRERYVSKKKLELFFTRPPSVLRSHSSRKENDDVMEEHKEVYCTSMGVKKDRSCDLFMLFAIENCKL